MSEWPPESPDLNPIKNLLQDLEANGMLSIKSDLELYL